MSVSTPAVRDLLVQLLALLLEEQVPAGTNGPVEESAIRGLESIPEVAIQEESVSLSASSVPGEDNSLVPPRQLEEFYYSTESNVMTKLTWVHPAAEFSSQLESPSHDTEEERTELDHNSESTPSEYSIVSSPDSTSPLGLAPSEDSIVPDPNLPVNMVPLEKSTTNLTVEPTEESNGAAGISITCEESLAQKLDETPAKSRNQGNGYYHIPITPELTGHVWPNSGPFQYRRPMEPRPVDYLNWSTVLYNGQEVTSRGTQTDHDFMHLRPIVRDVRYAAHHDLPRDAPRCMQCGTSSHDVEECPTALLSYRLPGSFMPRMPKTRRQLRKD